MSTSPAHQHGRKWIHFWLFGPELGCVKRELPIIEALCGKYELLLVVHPEHAAPLRQHLKDKPIAIIAYHHGVNLEYDTHFNLRRAKTIWNIAKFVAWQWMKDFGIFKRVVKLHPPAVIVADFLPYVALWANIFKIPSLGVYNYSLTFTDFGNGLLNRTLAFIVPPIFKLAYKCPTRMFSESLAPREIPNATSIPLLRRGPDTNDSPASEHDYLIALGGKSDPATVLKFFAAVHRHAPELTFRIAPRAGEEFFNLSGAFRIANTGSPLSTFRLMHQVGGVITKAGFSTVAEALQLHKKLFIIMLANHPEIQETAHQLFAMGLAKPLSLAMEPQEVANILTAPFRSDKQINFGGEKIIIAAIEKYMTDSSGNIAC
jgi:uncharacterized protein (TIGR00661 family)